MTVMTAAYSERDSFRIWQSKYTLRKNPQKSIEL